MRCTAAVALVPAGNYAKVGLQWRVNLVHGIAMRLAVLVEESVYPGPASRRANTDIERRQVGRCGWRLCITGASVLSANDPLSLCCTISYHSLGVSYLSLSPVSFDLQK